MVVSLVIGKYFESSITNMKFCKLSFSTVQLGCNFPSFFELLYTKSFRLGDYRIWLPHFDFFLLYIS